MLNKIWEKTNPSELKKAWSKLNSRVKPAAAEGQKSTLDSPGSSEKNKFSITINNEVKQELTCRIEGTDAPDFIKQFVYEHWSRLMQEIYQKRGPKSDVWAYSVQLIDDLVRITDDKQANGIKDREKDLGFLLHRLKRGMDIIQLPAAVRDRFLSQLVTYDKSLVEKPSEPEPSVSPKAAHNPNALFADELLVDNKKPV